MSAKRCKGCQRILVTRTDWYAIPPDDRKSMYRTHAMKHGLTTCQACGPRAEGYTESDLVYTGGWENVGGVMKPKYPTRGMEVSW